MTIAQMTCERERMFLSEFACLSENTKGREQLCAPCTTRTEFQRDRDRIIHCKAFRRLMHKTQVFLCPEDDHYRTRLTHTLEVTQIARTIARGLSLNEDLTEAAALGHDLGHTPFGHAGEYVLQECYSPDFTHYRQSLRVVDKLENGGVGLNLTYEVRDGILNHAGENLASTLEGRIVKYADRIAYINHDIDDAIRGKILKQSDIPADLCEILGFTHSERIGTLVNDIIYASTGKNDIMMTDEVYDAMMAARIFVRACLPKSGSQERGSSCEGYASADVCVFCRTSGENAGRRIQHVRFGRASGAARMRLYRRYDGPIRHQCF